MVNRCFETEQVGNVLLISLNKPPVNALTLANYGELADLFEGLGADGEPDVAVLRSASSRAFCAGADISESPTMDAVTNEKRQRESRRLFSAIRHCPIPVIAAVNAPALGAGLVLAEVCDIRLAGPRATFGLPEINVGKCGGGRHTSRLASQGIVRLMYFTGRALNVEEARDAGIVDRLVPGDDDALHAAALELAQDIARKSPLAIRYAKESLNLAEELPIEDGYVVEQQFTMRLAATLDGQEAAAAFIEKREPQWKRA